MKEWFLARGYPEIVVFGRGQSVTKNLTSSIPFVTTYHPNVKLIRDVLPFLYRMEKFKRFSQLLRSYLTELQEKQKII